MDSVTHSLVGVGIAAIALDYLSNSSNNGIATFFVTITSSLIPDIDVVSKFLPHHLYMKHHRGLSHTFVAWPIFSTLIAIPASLIFKVPFFSFFLLAMAGIIAHILLDVSNSYGTMIVPNKKKISLSYTKTFDFFITILLTTTTVIYVLTKRELNLYYFAFAIVILYIIFKALMYSLIKKKVNLLYPDHKIIVAPRSKLFDYHIYIEGVDSFTIMKQKIFKLKKEITLSKGARLDATTLALIENHANYKAFIEFSPMYYTTINDNQHGQEIRLTDIRYMRRDYYFYNAIFIVKDKEIITSMLAWILSENKVQKKLQRRIEKHNKKV